MKIPGYGKLFHLGKPEVRPFFNEAVVIQEKVDGSRANEEP